MKSKNVNMLSGSIFKGLLSMTIPIMIMNVMQSMFNIIDMTVMKMAGKTTAVGAIGACGSLTTLCTCLLIGVSTGANVVVARRIGAKDKAAADRAVTTGILTAIIGGFALMVIGVIFAETFLKWTNVDAVLLPQSTAYFRIYFCGMPSIMLYNFCASILRATGDTKKPMYFLILSGAIKCVLTVWFVWSFDSGVGGVALATIIANVIVTVLAFLALTKSKVINVNFKEFKIDVEELKDMLFIGIPAGLQSALYSFANVIIMTVVNSFGPDATTGISIANQYDGILYQISVAPSLAVTPYVAQNIGAGNLKRVKQTLVRAMCITVAFGATFGALSAIFSGPLSGIMSSSPAVIAYSQQKMMLISSTYFICGINEIMCGTLRGMGKPIIPTISTLIFMCAIRFVWVYVIYPLLPPNLTYLYLIWPIGWILSSSTLFISYLTGMSKLQKKVGTQNRNSVKAGYPGTEHSR